MSSTSQALQDGLRSSFQKIFHFKYELNNTCQQEMEKHKLPALPQYYLSSALAVKWVTQSSPLSIGWNVAIFP